MESPELYRAMFVFAVVFFIIGITSIPYLVGKIPQDYFLQERRSWRSSLAEYGPVFVIVLIAKNLLALILIAAGILMLFLPGQGLLTIFIGMLLLDFPGKYRTESWLIRQPPIHNSVNWLRRKRNIPPIHLPDD